MFGRMMHVWFAVCMLVGLALVGQAPSASADGGQTESESYYVMPMKVVVECLGCVADPAPVQVAGVQLSFAAPFGGKYATPVNFSSPYGAYIAVGAPAAIQAYGKTLVFKHWRSVTDNKVITNAGTLAGYLNKPETLAAVYQAQAPAQQLTLDIKGECQNCAFNVGIGGLAVPLNTMQGPKTTPTQMTLPVNGQLALAAPLYFMIQGHLLQFVSWRSVTDNKVLSLYPTLVGFADKTETLAAVYREVQYFKGWEDATLDKPAQ